jgi:hypothetical protein
MALGGLRSVVAATAEPAGTGRKSGSNNERNAALRRWSLRQSVALQRRHATPLGCVTRCGSDGASPYLLFCGLGFFSRQHKCVGEIVDILVHQKGSDCVIERLLETRRGRFAMNAARNRLVLREGIH